MMMGDGMSYGRQVITRFEDIVLESPEFNIESLKDLPSYQEKQY